MFADFTPFPCATQSPNHVFKTLMDNVQVCHQKSSVIIIHNHILCPQYRGKKAKPQVSRMHKINTYHHQQISHFPILYLSAEGI